MAEQVPPKKSSYWSNVVTTLAVLLVVIGLVIAFRVPINGLVLVVAGAAIAAIQFLVRRSR